MARCGAGLSVLVLRGRLAASREPTFPERRRLWRDCRYYRGTHRDTTRPGELSGGGRVRTRRRCRDVYAAKQLTKEVATIHRVVHRVHLMTEHRLGHPHVPHAAHRRRRTQAEEDVEGDGTRAVPRLQHAG